MTKIGWLLGMVLAAAHAKEPDPRTEIIVQLYNYAKAPKKEVRQAEVTVGWLFQKAGIHVHWVECPPLDLARGADQVCQQAADPRLFVLSIINWDSPRGSDSVLGFALLQGEANHAAAVYPRIKAVAENNPARQDCGLLGSVLAHELGHLVFRSTQHGEGIMRPRWISGDYQLMTHRRLVFTHEQARMLRKMLDLRIEQFELSSRQIALSTVESKGNDERLESAER